ncbi:hypothetical protein OSTOST_20409, partial [Ostertagia ostertagi]
GGDSGGGARHSSEDNGSAVVDFCDGGREDDGDEPSYGSRDTVAASGPEFGFEGFFGQSQDVMLVEQQQNTQRVARTTIMATELNFTKILSVELHSDPRTHRSLRHAIERHGSVDITNQCAHVGVNVRLCRAVTGTDPLFEVLASENLFQNIPVRSPSVANDILNAVYGSPRRRSMTAAVPSRPLTPVSVRLGSSTIRFRPDQAQAVQLGCENRPILAVQAAYGTGKTVVG